LFVLFFLLNPFIHWKRGYDNFNFFLKKFLIKSPKKVLVKWPYLTLPLESSLHKYLIQLLFPQQWMLLVKYKKTNFIFFRWDKIMTVLDLEKCIVRKWWAVTFVSFMTVVTYGQGWGPRELNLNSRVYKFKRTIMCNIT
jgi:hypothetical protein